MFLESTSNRGKRRGWIEVVCGSMFSGKTEELIRRLKRAQFARQRVEIFKPAIDNRYSDEEVVSHKGSTIPSTPVQHSSALLLLASDVEVVGIDEAQFFDDGLPDVVNKLANGGVRVIIAGLDLDFKGRPFGCMPTLLAMAEYVTKVHAVCVKTGNLAHYSYRFTDNERLVALGESESYIPLSREAFNEAQENPEAMNEEARAWEQWQKDEEEKRRLRLEEIQRAEQIDSESEPKTDGPTLF